MTQAPFGDFNRDGDVDQEDFAAFQRCWTRPNQTATPVCADAFDCTRDGYIDSNDLQQFIDCSSGPTIPAITTCGECLPLAAMSPLFTLDRLKSAPDRPENIVWGALVVLLILLVAFYLIIDYGTNGRANIHLARQRFIEAGYCPNSDKIATLRTYVDQFGPGGIYCKTKYPQPGDPPAGSDDPNALAVYQVLNEALKDCSTGQNRIFLVPKTVADDNGVYATTLMYSPDTGGVPDGMELIFITDSYVKFAPPPGEVSRMPAILFSQGDHIVNRRSGMSHQDLQDRLDDFSMRMGLTSGPRWVFKHGKEEGMQNP